MNSSISSSDAAARPDGPLWRRFAVTLVAGAAAVLALALAAIFLIDPYDTGRSPFFSQAGVRALAPATGNASRGRDPAFDAMIAGNSRIQLISPERLKAATGLDFVQMSVPGSGPREQLALIDWFLGHRRAPVKALLVSIDESWCTADPALPSERPFPFWLYAASRLDYARGLLRWEVLEEVPPRLSHLLGMSAERLRPDGYWDYDAEYTQKGDKAAAAHRQEMRARPYANAQRYDRDPAEGTRSFPAAERLGTLAAALPGDAVLILVVPPLYINALPPEGTEQAFRLRACTAALAESARKGHARTALIDWRTDRPETRDPARFFDRVHYRQPVARAMEADIADAFRRVR
ncbi:hypothetical protein HPT29_019550 [Microvirga terrae]|uniref:SGNH/GDSL hydrolase family protein n=1 Tax=Microvirga terrae TaxID=2740529 RepID=A0ABY5RN50_9HYPH|nr:hypothetical protein [Microvirga terrae]UVF18663.1 hypothetical protein HPT29_019550 [Microvirga terrae]